MNDLSPQARALIDAARDGDDPTPADRDRVGRALMQTIAGGAVMLAAGSASTAAGGALSAKAIAMVVAASVVVGGTATVGVVVVHQRAQRHAVVQTVRREPVARPTPPSVTLPAPAGAPAPVVEPAPAVAPIPAPEPPRKAAVARRDALEPAPAPAVTPLPPPPPAPPAPPTPPTPPPTPADTLAAEARDLREVQSALRVGDAARALRLLEAQSGRYPHGQLAEERAAARVMALCQAGRRSEATPAISAFLRDYPRSPLVGRVRSACQAPAP